MKISLVTTGSLGDVLPFIALGVGLSQKGHHICLATHEMFEDLITDNGLSFAPIYGDFKELSKSDIGLEYLDSGRGAKFLELTFTLIKRDLISVSNDCLKACQRADAMIYGASVLSACHVAEKLSIPSIVAWFSPFLPTKDFPHVLLKGVPDLGIFNRLSWTMVQQYGWMRVRPIINQWRASVGLPPESMFGFLRRLEQMKIPFLFCYSPSLVPSISDAPEITKVTGYWHMNKRDYMPEKGLLEFLNSGPKPIYVGFGSMQKRNPEDFTHQLIEAVRGCGERLILSMGWAGLGNISLPSFVYIVGDCPHDWLFPKVRLAMHHGGAGTSHAACRAGIPSIVAPFIADQFYWAERLRVLGVSPKEIPQPKLNAKTIADSLMEVLENNSYHQNALALGQRMSTENGVMNAVRFVEEMLCSKNLK